MDTSFKDRLDKVFASISSSSSSSTPWSVSDAEVERRVWNRDKGDNRDDDETVVSSCFDNMFTKPPQTGDVDGDEWEIRSSIGLDSTLDNEEEEDAYDKMAEGRENGGDRLYMKDVTDHGPYLNSHNVLPTSVHDVDKDHRAKTRLREDDAQGSDEPMLNAEEACVSFPGTRIKPILKRKSDAVVKSPAKRVRFDSTCKNDTVQVPEAKASQNGVGVPDYILNPSKYTRYSFDDFSHHVEEGSNSKAYMDFLEHVKNSKPKSVDVPKSVVFMPRKKRGEAVCKSEGQLKQSSTKAGPGIAAGEVEHAEISEMQEDESHVAAVCTKARFQKPGRQYRNKMEADDDVS